MGTVRASSPAHWADIAWLQREVLPSDQPCDVSRGAWWVIYAGSSPIAFGGITPSLRWSDCMYLCRAGVVEGAQGRGLQKRLIRIRERYARRQGMNWIVTDTWQNPASSNSLISCGYKLFDPSVPWGKRHALYWRKRLTQAQPEKTK